MKLWSYSLRELFKNRRFAILFVLNLSLGLTGFIALDGFKNSLEQTIKGRSKAVLGADFGISTRRPVTAEEVSKTEALLPNNFKATRMIEMFSMVASQSGDSRLVQLKAIEGNYPFYGSISLEESGELSSDNYQSLNNQQQVWIYPELRYQLGVDKGDEISIGDAKFVVAGVVSDDAAAGLSTSMAPRIYISLQQFAKTGLLRKGSIAWHSVIYQLPGQNSLALDEIRESVFKAIDSPEVRVYTHENVSEQMTALITRLNDFLGLASLVAMFLAGIGAAFLFRSYFRKNTKTLATLLCLGLGKGGAFVYLSLQIIVLGLISGIVATLLSFAIVPGLGNLTQQLLPFNVEFQLSLQTIVVGLLIGTVGSLIIGLPILAGMANLSPALLLVNDRNNQWRWQLLPIVAALPGIALFWGLSVFLSHSYQVGSLFTGLFLASAVALGAMAIGLFKSLNRFAQTKILSLRWALRDLARSQLTTIVVFVAIGLGSLLLNLIPQIQASLAAELERPEQSKLPSLFLFDIQEEQVETLEQTLQAEQISIDKISPMIRARLMSVNGETFDKGEGSGNENLSREQESEMRFRNRGFNLTYRENLTSAETIEEGVGFSGTFDENSGELPQISVEKRFAGRLKLKIGDVLKFDIESIPIEGKIVNLRKVKWTSFQPNFFVQFQPGVLEIAPKTFVATVPKLDLAKKNELQSQLVKALPNVSMVDVSRIVKRISEIIEQMSWALVFMSFLCLLAGFVVIYSIANHQANQRRWDIGLLKTVGADFQLIRGQFFWQFALITGIATTLGAILSLVVSYFISSVLFDSAWIFNGFVPVLSVALSIMMSLVVTHLAVQRSLSVKPRELLSQ